MNVAARLYGLDERDVEAVEEYARDLAIEAGCAPDCEDLGCWDGHVECALHALEEGGQS